MTELQRLANYINGVYVPPLSGTWLVSNEPATGLPATEVPDSNAADIEVAVAAARQAFPAWSGRSAAERSSILMRVAELIERDAQRLAEAESKDQGKPVQLALAMDIPRAAENFRFFARAILHAEESSVRTAGGIFNYVSRQPLGVAGLISPWNLPLYLLTWKIAPAIAVGNTAVCKPSELTSVTAFLLGALLTEAGVPPGVVNLVFGRGATAGAALVAHPEVPLISFTGGTATGQAIARTAGPMFKRLSLELGGKNANIVFADCDFERAVATTIRSSFLNQGEICLCGSRLFVQRGIYDAFLAAFTEKTRALKVGDPRDPDSFMGALVSREHLAKVRGYLELGRAQGGRFLTGEEPLGLSKRVANGYFLRPTIIADVPQTSALWCEEIFGPVVTIAPFDTADEAVSYANATAYGLSATIWTRDLECAHRTADRLGAGTIWVNDWMRRDLRVPFGGMKASGVGREGGDRSLDFYTETKTICVRYSP